MSERLAERSRAPAPGAEAALTARLEACEAELAALRSRCAGLESLREVIHASPLVAVRWRLEPGWPVEYVSENISRFGYTAEELMSGAVSWFDVLQPAAGAGEMDSFDTPEQVSGYRLLSYAVRCRPEGKRLVRFVIRTRRDDRGAIVCEGMLRESGQHLEDEERLRLLEQAVNTATNGIIIADATQPDHPVIFANRAVEQVSGYAPEDFLGRNCRFLQGPDTDQPALKRIRTALGHRTRCEAVLRNYRKDGTLFWNEIRIAPVTNRRGEVTHFIGVQADITARKQAEAALTRRDAILEAVSRAAETLLRTSDYEAALPAALRQIGAVTGADHLCVWRQAGTSASRTLNLLRVWSGPRVPEYQVDRFQQIPWEPAAGWPASETLRAGHWVQGSLGHCTPEERALAEAMGVKSFLCLPIFDGPDHFWGVLTLGCVPSDVVWAPIEVEALLSATRVLGAVIQNQTTAMALQASEQRFRSLVSNLKEIVFQTDAQGNWTYLNRAWTEVTGHAVGASIGRLFLDYVHSEDREKNTRLFAPLIQRQKEYCRHRVRYLTKAGGFRWIEVFARLALGENDEITGTAGTLTDVTEQVQAEEVRRRQLAAIEAAIDGVAIFDAAGVFTYLNSTQLALFGYEAGTTPIGRTWRECYGPEEIAFIEAKVLPVVAARGAWRGELKARRQDGTCFAEEVSLTQVEGGGLVCVCRDIS